MPELPAVKCSADDEQRRLREQRSLLASSRLWKEYVEKAAELDGRLSSFPSGSRPWLIACAGAALGVATGLGQVIAVGLALRYHGRCSGLAIPLWLQIPTDMVKDPAVIAIRIAPLAMSYPEALRLRYSAVVTLSCTPLRIAAQTLGDTEWCIDSSDCRYVCDLVQRLVDIGRLVLLAYPFREHFWPQSKCGLAQVCLAILFELSYSLQHYKFEIGSLPHWIVMDLLLFAGFVAWVVTLAVRPPKTLLSRECLGESAEQYAVTDAKGVFEVCNGTFKRSGDQEFSNGDAAVMCCEDDKWVLRAESLPGFFYSDVLNPSPPVGSWKLSTTCVHAVNVIREVDDVQVYDISAMLLLGYWNWAFPIVFLKFFVTIEAFLSGHGEAGVLALLAIFRAVMFVAGVFLPIVSPFAVPPIWVDRIQFIAMFLQQWLSTLIYLNMDIASWSFWMVNAVLCLKRICRDTLPASEFLQKQTQALLNRLYEVLGWKATETVVDEDTLVFERAKHLTVAKNVNVAEFASMGLIAVLLLTDYAVASTHVSEAVLLDAENPDRHLSSILGVMVLFLFEIISICFAAFWNHRVYGNLERRVWLKSGVSGFVWYALVFLVLVPLTVEVKSSVACDHWGKHDHTHEKLYGESDGHQ